ncbi:MAG: DUF192 domain-containing protein [Paracoccaceae bacterium]
MPFSLRTALAAAALLPALASPVLAAACRDEAADFRWQGGTAHFTVEIADTEGERARGLMFRSSLPEAEGMLFVYGRPQPVAFWMKNTLIPLDMIFIGEDGRVRSVHAGAIPHDETPIPGGADIRFVLEINAGLAGTLGIAPGAEFRHPLVDPRFAAWACD